MKKTQRQRILDLLSDGKLHSTLEMRNEMFIMSPASRILELKAEGHNIITEDLPANPNNPDSAKIAWYKLVIKGQSKLFEVNRRY